MSADFSSISDAVRVSQIHQLFSEIRVSFPPEFLSDPDAFADEADGGSSNGELDSDEQLEFDNLNREAREQELEAFELQGELPVFWTQRDITTLGHESRLTLEIGVGEAHCRVTCVRLYRDSEGHAIFTPIRGNEPVRAAEAADPLFIAFVYPNREMELNLAPSTGGKLFVSDFTESMAIVGALAAAEELGVSALSSMNSVSCMNYGLRQLPHLEARTSCPTACVSRKST